MPSPQPHPKPWPLDEGARVKGQSLWSWLTVDRFHQVVPVTAQSREKTSVIVRLELGWFNALWGQRLPGLWIVNFTQKNFSWTFNNRLLANIFQSLYMCISISNISYILIYYKVIFLTVIWNDRKKVFSECYCWYIFP